MQLLREAVEPVELVVEGINSDKKLYIEGVFLQSGIKNRNGRMYPEEIMDKEVNRYITEKINTNSAYGEFTHPSSPQINLKDVSHLITSLVKEGKNYHGKAKILDTPNGNIAKGILNGGGRLGVSSRALGTLKMNNEGVNIVQNDFMLSTAGDLVLDPSAPDAFIQGIMEGVEWIYEATSNSWIQATMIKEEIKKMKSSDIHLKQAAFFERFLKNL
jgi:hypothetical protein